MAQSSECFFCISPYSDKRKLVICPHCQYECCHICLGTFSLDHLSLDTMGTVCPNPKCKAALSYDFLVRNVGLSFISGKYKQKRKELLLTHQTSLLSATQENAKQYKQISDYIHRLQHECIFLKESIVPTSETIRTLRKQERDLLRELRNSSSDEHREHTIQQIRIVEETIRPPEFQHKLHELHLAQQTLERFVHEHLSDHVDDIDHEQTKSLFPCPNHECRGFVHSDYVCGMCNVTICSDCEKIKSDEHMCHNEDIETVKYIKSNSKPCPQCCARISKKDGCDQMWCVGCKTAFSWETGRKDKGRVHNPEYFAWLRQHGHQEELANQHRNAQRIHECDEQITYTQLYQFVLSKRIRDKETKHIVELYRNVSELPIEPIQSSPFPLLRVKFLNNQLTKKQFETELVKAERKRMKENFVRSVFRQAREMTDDYFRLFLRDQLTCKNIFDRCDVLVQFLNDQFKSFEDVHGLACPRFETTCKLLSVQRKKKDADEDDK